MSGLASPEGDEGATARINLRLPEHLKTRVDEAAASEGLSINTWLVRSLSVALERSNSAVAKTVGHQLDLSDTPAGAGSQEGTEMTVFQTPEPISVSLEFGIGDLRLVASDSTETVVEVGPTDPTKEGDVNAESKPRSSTRRVPFS